MNSFCTTKVLVLLVLVLFTTSLFIGYYYTSSMEYSYCGYNSALLNPDVLKSNYRRMLADKIAAVQFDIAKATRSKTGVVDPKWALQLSKLVAELDPRPRSSSKIGSEWDFSAHLQNMRPASNTTPDGRTRYVCPEVYKFDIKHKPYFQKGMYQENCTYVPKFYELLTVLIPTQLWKPEKLHFISKRIAMYYDIRILGIVRNASIVLNSIDRKLTYIKVTHKESDSEVITRAMKLIKTPFVLIGNSLSQFNNQSSLERLIRVLDELPLVKVAAGAARDSQGRWIHGCLQQKMENYCATYNQGYYSSKYECMYCDDLLTPFVTYTDMFEKVPLQKGLNGSIVFHDWFVKIRHAGHLVVTCPDVMFYVHTHPEMTTSDWRKFAQRWSLNRIQSYNGTVIEFSCSESKISCKGIYRSVKTYLIPPCCLKNILEEIGYILDFADMNNIHYELQAGSVLGAVKMGTHLPWDLDMDILFACDDWNVWMEIKEKYLQKKKCKLRINIKNVYFIIRCQTLFYEFYCRSVKHNMSRELIPEEFINIPTKIKFGGRWTSVISNPGLYSRNRYGMEDLRHAPHWRYVKTKSSRGNNYKPGAWNKCATPNHHACLDHFSADGSLQFVKK